jgi:hypothetical protein
MVSMAAVITGTHHLRVWDVASAAAAQATAWISWMFILSGMCFSLLHYTFGMAVLKTCFIVLTVTHIIYTLMLYIPDDSLRSNLDPPDYSDQ